MAANAKDKDKARRARELRAARDNLTREPIEHPRFAEAFAELEIAAESSPLTLLLALSGVGKTYLSQLLVLRRLAAPLRPVRVDPDDPDEPLPRLAAAYVVAPSSQRGAFSWKALWARVLAALHSPRPDTGFDPERCAAALRAGVRQPGVRVTEARLFDDVCRAGADRGLELLVIDEACSLLKSDAGRTLPDQLDVLRELADLSTFNVVLVSTFRIVEYVTSSSELNRRLTQVLLPRYLAASDELGCEEDYVNFCRVAASLMERVPEWARMPLGRTTCRRLYNGSLGCVGVLADWWERALARAAKAQRSLAWVDFERSALSRDDRARMQRDVRLAAEYLALRGDISLDCLPDDLPDPSPPPVFDSTPKRRRRKPRRPKRHPVPPSDPTREPPEDA